MGTIYVFNALLGKKIILFLIVFDCIKYDCIYLIICQTKSLTALSESVVADTRYAVDRMKRSTKIDSQMNGVWQIIITRVRKVTRAHSYKWQ